MFSGILDSPVFKHPKAWWLPLLSLGLTLHGILFLHWNFQPIVFMVWFEVILMLAFGLFRMLFAFDGKGWTSNLGRKIGLLVGGGFMGIALIMLTVTFTFKVFENGFVSEGFARIPFQVRVLFVGYIAGLIIHYFGNGRYLIAEPLSELAMPYLQVFILLTILMPITMHLLPKYPQLNQAMWAAVTVALAKFAVDAAFSRWGQLGKTMMEKSATEA